MKEQLYTIPLMDAFREKDECPFCFIHRSLEQHAIDFTLGSGASYMEDDIRFCLQEDVMDAVPCYVDGVIRDSYA